MKSKSNPGIALLLLLSFFTNTKGQTPDWIWARSMGGSSFDRPYSVTCDHAGNVYMTGAFYSTADYDPGPGTATITSAGFEDIFISKLNASGNLIWVKRIGGISFDIGQSIKSDAAGNVYTTGQFKGTVDFDPGTGNFNLTSAGGNSDVFILKLDSSGNFIWAKQIAGTSDDISQSLVIDSNGKLIMIGYFRGTADFDPGNGVYNLSASTGHDDVFVLKLDTAGNFLWAKAMDGAGNAYGRSLGVDLSDNIYLTGYFEGSIDFNPEPTDTFTITAAGSKAVFLCKLSDSGNFIWAKAIGGAPGVARGFSLSLDLTGENFYVTGYFYGNVDFDPDSANSFYLPSTGISNEIFISQLDTSGNFGWAKKIGGTLPSDECDAINLAQDASGNLYSTGWFSGTIDFDPDSGIFNLTSNGGYDTFIYKLDNSGNFKFAKRMGGISSDYGQAIAINSEGNVYLIGNFESASIQFDNTNLTNTDIGFTPDVFIAKLDTSSLTGDIELTWNDDEVLVYPNPAHHYFSIALKNIHSKAEVIIIDMHGKIIYTIAATGEQKIEVNTKDFANGIYLIQIIGTDFPIMKKLVVTK
jgi:hypothetical protein